MPARRARLAGKARQVVSGKWRVGSGEEEGCELRVSGFEFESHERWRLEAGRKVEVEREEGLRQLGQEEDLKK